MATLVGWVEMFHTIMQCGILSYQVRSGRLSVRSKGNFLKWLCAKLRVVKDGGRDPGSTSLRWFLSKFSQIRRRKDLKKLGGTLVRSFSPKKMVLTVSLRCRKLTSSNSAISFLLMKCHQFLNSEAEQYRIGISNFKSQTTRSILNSNLVQTSDTLIVIPMKIDPIKCFEPW